MARKKKTETVQPKGVEHRPRYEEDYWTEKLNQDLCKALGHSISYSSNQKNVSFRCGTAHTEEELAHAQKLLEKERARINA